jgi:cobalt-precorrin 5A hydrolase/precorrin-3B C17-methyltransferase
LLRHRRPDTPVVVGRQLARPGESLDVMRLADLGAAQIDMLSVVVVGSSQTRRFDTGARRWIYTPRGYATGVASAA